MNKKSLVNHLAHNKLITVLLGILLVLLNLFMLNKMPWLFYPLKIMSQIIGPPLIIATVFFYLFNPVIQWFQKKGINRVWGVLILFLTMIALLVISILYVFPLIQKQVEAIIVVLPRYFYELVRLIESIIQTSEFNQIYEQIQGSNMFQSITEQGTNLFTATISGVGNFVSVISQVVLVVLTVPFILYFLLVSPEKLPNNIMKITPLRWRKTVATFLSNVHEQLSIYVRGQLMVAFFVGVAFLIGFSIIELDFYIVLAIIGGVLNMVPYLGSIVAATLALIIGFFQSPIMVVYVLIVIMLESLIENRIIQPFILGNQLNIHPVTILFIMLIAGKMLGVTGLLLGIPMYAILKIMAQMIFDYVHEQTDWYIEDERDIKQSKQVLVDPNND